MASGEIKISEFQELTSAQLTDTVKIPVISGDILTNKTIAIDGLIEDSLTSQNEFQALSANQGYILNNTKISKGDPISPSTKTKITYNSDGIIISATDATTADIVDSTNKRYVTDSQLSVISNTSGVNSGDNKIGSKTINETGISNGKILSYNSNSDKIEYIAPTYGVTDHMLLSNIGTNTHAQIDSHIASTSNPHNVTKTQVGLSSVPNLDTTSAVANEHTHSNKAILDALSDNSGDLYYNGNPISALEADPIFTASQAFNIDANDITNLSNLSGVNTGDQDLSGYALRLREFDQKAVNYTFILTDANKIIETNSVSDITLTVPLNSSVAYPIGTEINILRYGTGNAYFEGEVGVTIRSRNGYVRIGSQYAGAALIKRDTDEWYLVGNLIDNP